MSPTKKRIHALLETMPLCPRTASEAAFTSRRNAGALLAELYEEGASHISGWDRPARGACTPIYRAGPGEDAPRPPCKPRASVRKNKIRLEDRLLALVLEEPMSAEQAADCLCVIPDHIRKLFKGLHQQKLVRIAAWVRKSRGPYFPCYLAGAGRDKKKPDPLPASVRCMAYRKRLKGAFDERYGAVRELQREHIPGRRLVIDGKVVYQQ